MTKKTTKQDGNPAFMFYPNDWLSSPDLNACSLEAQGLWIKMLCIMYQSPIRGVLLLPSGKQIDNKTLSKFCGVDEQIISKLLKELEDNGVFSRLDNQAIYNRRMYREGLLSKIRSEARRSGWDKQNLYKTDTKAIQKGSKLHIQKRYKSDTKCLQNFEDESIMKPLSHNGLDKQGGNNTDTKPLQNLYKTSTNTEQEQLTNDFLREKNKEKKIQEKKQVKRDYNYKKHNEEKPKERKEDCKEGRKTGYIIDLPPYIQPAIWNEYLEMRKKIRKPMTDYAKYLAMKKLERFQSQGYDPNKILEQSILHSWQGLFLTKDTPTLPRYNEDTEFICSDCKQIRKKDEREYGSDGRARCKSCHKKYIDGQEKEQKQEEERKKREWESMTEEQKKKILTIYEKLNIPIPEWMAGEVVSNEK